MKKLLNLLASFAVVSSSAICMVACKSVKKNSKGLPDNLTITSEKTVEDFKAKIIDEIKKETDFSEVESTEINIFKEDGKTALTVNDITNSIKIKIKVDTKKISADKVVTVTWTEKTANKKNLNILLATVNVTSLKTIADFTDKLIIASKVGKEGVKFLFGDMLF